MTRRPFVFLDKDGTLVEDVPYNVDPERIRLVPGAVDALRRLQGAGFGLAVISNQSGVARGFFGEDAVRLAGRHLIDGLAALDVHVSGFYYCPHHPDGSIAEYAIACDCRKPAPGLLRRAAAQLDADLARSWFVGDILDDVEAGRRAGCRTVLLDAGHETEWLTSPDRWPDALAADLPAAADFILAAAGGSGAVAPQRALATGRRSALAARARVPAAADGVGAGEAVPARTGSKSSGEW